MKNILKYIILPVISVWFVGLACFNFYINHYEIDKITKTDAIIALTGGSNRIKEAALLLNNDFSPILFISGVEKGISFHEILNVQKINISSGRKVFIERTSTNTVENAINTNEWIKNKNIKTIRLVTSNYHMPRSYLEFKSQNPGLIIIENPVFSSNVSHKWWKNWGTFTLLASEYSKFLIVYLKITLIELGKYLGIIS